MLACLSGDVMLECCYEEVKYVEYHTQRFSYLYPKSEGYYWISWRMQIFNAIKLSYSGKQ